MLSDDGECLGTDKDEETRLTSDEPTKGKEMEIDVLSQCNPQPTSPENESTIEPPKRV